MNNTKTNDYLLTPCIMAILLTLAMLVMGSFYTPVQAEAATLSIDSKDKNDVPLPGYWVEVRTQGNLVATGFTPVSFSIPTGSYTVAAGDYGNQYFKEWSAQGTERVLPVTLQSSSQVLSFTAKYHDIILELNGQNLPASNPSTSQGIKIQSEYIDGSPLIGMYVVMQQNGNTVETGFTPKTFASESLIGQEQFRVIVADYTGAYFIKWNDGQLDRARTISIQNGNNGENILKALYASSMQTQQQLQVSQQTPSSPTASQFVISSQYLDGSNLIGMYVVMQQNGNTVETGFTPKTFTLIADIAQLQQYTVTAQDYTGAYFIKWNDETTSRTRAITSTSNPSSLTAIYSSTSQQTSNAAPSPSPSPPPPSASSPAPGSSSITIYAHRMPSIYWDSCFAATCNTGSGTGPGASMFFALYDTTGQLVRTGFANEDGTTFSGLQNGVQYFLIYPSDCNGCHGSDHDVLFSHWDDGSSTRPKSISPGQTARAYFAYVPHN